MFTEDGPLNKEIDKKEEEKKQWRAVMEERCLCPTLMQLAAFVLRLGMAAGPRL